jgi:hypothetical protein
MNDSNNAADANKVFEHANSTLSPIMRSYTPLGRKKERYAA